MKSDASTYIHLWLLESCLPACVSDGVCRKYMCIERSFVSVLLFVLRLDAVRLDLFKRLDPSTVRDHVKFEG